MKNMENYNFREKNILVRVDLNVPTVNGIITDKSRIEVIKPTIKKLLNLKNKVFIISHFGRPKGKEDKKYSLEFICPALEQEFKINKIHFLNNFEEHQIKRKINDMAYGEICLFENIRFWPGEENNDLNFAKEISKNFDAYINDAFSASHRKHASIVSIPNFLPSYAGYSMLNEIKNINYFVNNPQQPNLAIIGGSKISTKIAILKNLCETCNVIAIGGAMANTFLYANKIDIGKSLCEKELSKLSLSILEKAKKFNCEIILPVDVVCADNLFKPTYYRTCDIKDIEPDEMVLDIGIKTIELIKNYIVKSKMILWNGPLGAFEYKPFEKSSIDIANIIKENSRQSKKSIIAGGGDTVSVIKMAKAESGFSYISKAGGAFLEWLEGKESPGFLALKKNDFF